MLPGVHKTRGTPLSFQCAGSQHTSTCALSHTRPHSYLGGTSATPEVATAPVADVAISSAPPVQPPRADRAGLHPRLAPAGTARRAAPLHAAAPAAPSPRPPQRYRCASSPSRRRPARLRPPALTSLPPSAPSPCVDAACPLTNPAPARAARRASAPLSRLCRRRDNITPPEPLLRSADHCIAARAQVDLPCSRRGHRPRRRRASTCLARSRARRRLAPLAGRALPHRATAASVTSLRHLQRPLPHRRPRMRRSSALAPPSPPAPPPRAEASCAPRAPGTGSRRAPCGRALQAPPRSRNILSPPDRVSAMPISALPPVTTSATRADIAIAARAATARRQFLLPRELGAASRPAARARSRTPLPLPWAPQHATSVPLITSPRCADVTIVACAMAACRRRPHSRERGLSSRLAPCGPPLSRTPDAPDHQHCPAALAVRPPLGRRRPVGRSASCRKTAPI